jgi:hypothetical protein
MAEPGSGGERGTQTGDSDLAAAFRIFLNYRREDASGHVGRLRDALRYGPPGEPGFTDDQIFMDIDTIEPGVDFRDAIREAVAVSDVFLSVIGTNWLAAVDSKGRRRLADPADFVRVEIHSALERAAEHDDVRIVPTRVNGAEMPAVEDLPAELADFAHRNAVELTDTRWAYDVERLLVWLKKLEQQKRERVTVDQEAAEAAAREREAAQAAARQREADERADRERKATERAAREQADRKAADRVAPRRRALTRAAAAAVVVAVAAGVAVKIISGGGEPPAGGGALVPKAEGALVWHRVGGRDLGGPGAQVITSLTETDGGEPTYVAGGSDSSPGDRDAAVWTSKSGRIWHRVPLPRPGDQAINTVLGTRDGLVAAGTDDGDAAFWESSDGTHWEPRALRLEGSDETVNRLSSTSVGLLGAGELSRDGDVDAAVWLVGLPDGTAGVDATRIEDPDFGGPGKQRINKIVQLPNGGRLVGVGAAGHDAGVWISDDGRAWERVADNGGLGSEGTARILDAVTFGSKVVAVGFDSVDGEETGAVWVSEDGERWTRVRDPGKDLGTSPPVWLSRVYGSQKLASSGVPPLIAAGSAGGDAAVWTSSDGTHWKPEPAASGEFGGPGRQAVRSLRVARLPVLAVGYSGSEDHENAAVWLGSR